MPKWINGVIRVVGLRSPLIQYPDMFMHIHSNGRNSCDETGKNENMTEDGLFKESCHKTNQSIKEYFTQFPILDPFSS